MKCKHDEAALGKKIILSKHLEKAKEKVNEIRSELSKI